MEEKPNPAEDRRQRVLRAVQEFERRHRGADRVKKFCREQEREERRREQRP